MFMTSNITIKKKQFSIPFITLTNSKIILKLDHKIQIDLEELHLKY